jgi:hypothetical protein
MYGLKLSVLLATAALLIVSKAVDARPPTTQRPLNDEVACDRVEKYTTDVSIYSPIYILSDLADQ